jgi:hypothetical protein
MEDASQLDPGLTAHVLQTLGQLESSAQCSDL